MKRALILLISIAMLLWVPAITFSAEHGGTEMKKEHGGKAVAAPSAHDIHKAMNDYIAGKSKATGTFDVYDAEIGKARTLKLSRIHDRVGKSGKYYYSCADFKDTVSGETVDLDLDVSESGGSLSVIDVRIHKVNGKERYTYDSDDNRIPVKK